MVLVAMVKIEEGDEIYISYSYRISTPSNQKTILMKM